MRSMRATSSVSPTGSGQDAIRTMRSTRWRPESAEEGELGARRRHPWLFRRHRSRVVGQIPRAPHCGRSGTAAHPEVAESRSDRRQGKDCRTKMAPRKGRRSRRCWLTFICIMRLTCGSSSGEVGMLTVMLSSCATLTISLSDSNIIPTPVSSSSELRERFAHFKLELHPEKTRLIAFGRYAAGTGQHRGEGKPSTFTFLGFTHFCATSKDGKFWMRRKTDSCPMRVKFAEVKDHSCGACISPLRSKDAGWTAVVRGHYAYYGVPTNCMPCACLPHPGDMALAPIAPATQPDDPPQLEAYASPRHPMDSPSPYCSSIAQSTLCR